MKHQKNGTFVTMLSLQYAAGKRCTRSSPSQVRGRQLTRSFPKGSCFQSGMTKEGWSITNHYPPNLETCDIEADKQRTSLLLSENTWCSPAFPCCVSGEIFIKHRKTMSKSGNLPYLASKYLPSLPHSSCHVFHMKNREIADILQPPGPRRSRRCGKDLAFDQKKAVAALRKGPGVAREFLYNMWNPWRSEDYAYGVFHKWGIRVSPKMDGLQCKLQN